MRYLITGGAGFIGSHLADALLARGDEVVVLDDLSTGRIENIEHHLGGGCLSFHEGSVLDYPLVDCLVREADAVVHLAAAVGVKLIVRRPLDSLLTNIRGTEIVLHAADRHSTKVLVASTSEIYGKNGHAALREDADRILGSPFKSRWAYSTSKAVDEILAHAYWRERGTQTIVVRLFNCVGPRQTGAYGMVVPRLVQQALRDEPLTVYGTGDQQRSFCHVADTVGALVGLIDHPLAIGDVFNVGAEREISINDLAALVIRMTGTSSDVVHVPYEVAYEEGFEDMERRLPDISKVRTLIGWQPARSLEEILGDVIAHERDKMPASPAQEVSRPGP